MRKLVGFFLAGLLLLITAVPAQAAFSDVGSSQKYRSAIEYLASQGIIHGYPDGSFRPGGEITRAELAKITVVASGVTPDSERYRSCFADVDRQWFAPYVCYARERGFLAGYPGNQYKAGDKVNRAEAVKIILNTLGVGFDTTGESFADVSAETWYALYAQTVRSQNLTDWGLFQAEAKLSRAEAAELIYQILINARGGLNFVSPAGYYRVSLRITTWWADSNGWNPQPTLQFNGKEHRFATPQEYVAALEKIRRHYATLGNTNFESQTTRYISQFENVYRHFPATVSSGPTTPASVAASVGEATVGHSVNFSGVDVTSEAAVRALSGPVVRRGDTTIYLGYESLVPNNRDPRIVSFTNGKQDWYRDDYETSSDESMGYGLIFADTETLYAAFTTRGTKEDINRDFRRFARFAWLSEYGEGSGKRATVIAKIDPATGDVLTATYLSARLNSGETNSLTVADLQMNGTSLVVTAESWFAPRRIDRQPMARAPNTGVSPYDYTIEFTPDLRTAVRAEAPNFGR
ncbi:MAG: S-layer homology domain-containing protein [Patescibacteria group bacterium]